METQLDPLTGLPTRKGFIAELKREVTRAPGAESPLVLVLFDVDGFGAVNGDAGRPAGDEVLRRVGTLLRQTAPATGVVARIGGDEFAALLPGTTLGDALSLADLLRQRVAALPVKAGLPLDLSYGAAEFWPGDDALRLLNRAMLDFCTRRAEEEDGSWGDPRPSPSAGRPSLRLLPGGSDAVDDAAA